MQFSRAALDHAIAAQGGNGRPEKAAAVKGKAHAPHIFAIQPRLVRDLQFIPRALSCLKEPCVVELYSDSKYVIDALSKGWVYGWQKRGWVKSDKKPALNADLWQELLPLIARHDVRYHWVKGHAANEKNNRCDQLAVAESKKF